MNQPALLALEDGSLFHGCSIGIQGQTCGEVVFNTSMTGYQEILTDPSYCQQMVTLTYPHIGNTGVNSADEESTAIVATGLIIRDLPLVTSSWRAEESLSDYLKRNEVVAIADIDTRQLTRILREKGALRGCIVTGDKIDEQAAIEAAKSAQGLKGMDLAAVVTTTDVYEWNEPSWVFHETGGGELPAAKSPEDADYHVVAYDYGVKRNILRMLVDLGCRVTVVPAKTTASEVQALSPDGVFLSNGPGDPEPCDYAIAAIKTLLEAKLPLFGICLGHQLLALACGAKTAKMGVGHHGANHPVSDLSTGQVMITSQNHGFMVDDSSLPSDLEVTHRSLFDDTIQGVHHTTAAAFGFQGHPEASPGPHDAANLFKHFIELMDEAKAKG